jgi:hypothetical protein
MSSGPLELKYKQDGEEAKEIAKYLPYFPFKVRVVVLSSLQCDLC